MAEPVTYNDAIQILGQDRVITAASATKAWGLSDPKDNLQIRYCLETLRKCSNQNKLDEADWRLIYINGISLRKQRDICQDDPERPHFSGDEWWLNPIEDFWADEEPRAGNCLINLSPKLFLEFYDEKSRAKAFREEGLVHCNEIVFTEALLLVFMINNGEIVTKKKWFHLGKFVNSQGKRLMIGYTNYGLVVSPIIGERCTEFMCRIVVCKKFDI